MTTSPAAARVLVASDRTADADQLVRQLQDEYTQIRSSTNPANAAADFEEFKPDVLLLAFDTLAKAQRYSLGLYRQSTIVGTHRHATVLLCSKDEVRSAFDLCKGGNFDDYVLHWPQAQDGQRLAMCIWNAAKSVAALVVGPSHQEMNNHAHQVVAVDSMLRHELSEGEMRLGGAARALQAAEHAIGAAIDEFSERLMDQGGVPIVSPKNGAALARELTRLKNDGISNAFRISSEELAPIAAWPRQLQERLEPHLAGMRDFAAAVSAAPSTLLIVDDDAFSRKLIAKTLADEPYSLEFAEDGAKALQLLRRIRPQLILMDIRLPDVDGIALTRKLKAAPHLADIPVLMLTGDARREILADSVVAGAAGFVVKPFTRDALMQQIARALRAPAV